MISSTSSNLFALDTQNSLSLPLSEQNTMADVEGAGFWLPSDFLDDFLVEKENIGTNNFTESDSEFCFPTEFPYDLGTNTDDLLQFSQKRRVMSTSPQSTLSHMSSWTGRSAGGSMNGSPNGLPSPPMTPKNDAVDHLIYLAAGQGAKLNLPGGYAAGPTKPKGLLSPQISLEQLYPSAKTHHSSVIPNIYLQQQIVKQQKQSYEMWPQMYQMGMGQDAWPVHPNPARIVGSGGRAAAKRGCAGTGVFLPRRYGNDNDCNAYASVSRKKSGYSAAAIPNRNLHDMNNNFDILNGFAQYAPKLGGGFVTEYDLLMARRNALLLQRRRGLLLEGSSPMNRGGYLPQ